MAPTQFFNRLRSRKASTSSPAQDTTGEQRSDTPTFPSPILVNYDSNGTGLWKPGQLWEDKPGPFSSVISFARPREKDIQPNQQEYNPTGELDPAIRRAPWVKRIFSAGHRTNTAPTGGLPYQLNVQGTHIDTVVLLQFIEARYSKHFENIKLEPVVQPKRSFQEQKEAYHWQEPGTTSPPYPPCLAIIPEDAKTSIFQLFNTLRLLDTAVTLSPVIFKGISVLLYGEPIGNTMDGLVERNRILRQQDKNIGTEPSIADRDDWYTDAVFAQQSFTGTNPTTITLASAEWIKRFLAEAEAQANEDVSTLLKAFRADSIYIQDYSYFRNAINADPDSVLKSDKGNRFGCAAVTLFLLFPDGRLHPLSIVLDYRVNMGNSVVIFNKRLTPDAPSASEKNDWPWRYAKLCNQVSDWTRHEMAVHLNDCHLVEEATIVAAQRSFSANHIIHRILSPHWLKTLSLNKSARDVLVPQVISEINGFTKYQTYQFILDAYSKRFDWTGRYIPNDLKRRGFPMSNLKDKKYHNYAWAQNMSLMWPVLCKFVASMLKTVYKSDAEVEKDKSIASWCLEMQSPTGGQMTSFPDIKTFDELTNAVVMCIHIASPQHNSINYLQCYYMAFVPSKPACLMSPVPTTLRQLQTFKESDMIAALPVKDSQVWLKSSQLPYLLSYGVAEDQTLVNYARSLAKQARDRKGEKWEEVQRAAKTLYDDLMELGIAFNDNSLAMDDQIVAYIVMDPTELAVSILL